MIRILLGLVLYWPTMVASSALFATPRLPFATLSLEEFRRDYTDNGRLYHGTTHENADRVSRNGRLVISRGADFHVTSDFATADYDFGYEQDSMRAIIHFEVQHPPGKLFMAVISEELKSLSFPDLVQLVRERKGDQVATRIQGYTEALRELGIDAIIYRNREGTVFKGHVVFLNGEPLKVPSLVEITSELARRYRLRKAENKMGDVHLDVMFSAYIYHFMKLSESDRNQAITGSRMFEISKIMEPTCCKRVVAIVSLDD